MKDFCEEISSESDYHNFKLFACPMSSFDRPNLQYLPLHRSWSFANRLEFLVERHLVQIFEASSF